MLHPVLHLLAIRPAWLAEHAEAYADLGAAELADASALCARALLLAAFGLCALGVASTLAGVALMLWALTPELPQHAAWLLLGVPALPLAMALASALALRRARREPMFLTLRQQLMADLMLLREAGAS